MCWWTKKQIKAPVWQVTSSGNQKTRYVTSWWVMTPPPWCRTWRWSQRWSQQETQTSHKTPRRHHNNRKDFTSIQTTIQSFCWSFRWQTYKNIHLSLSPLIWTPTQSFIKAGNCVFMCKKCWLSQASSLQNTKFSQSASEINRRSSSIFCCWLTDSPAINTAAKNKAISSPCRITLSVYSHLL